MRMRFPSRPLAAAALALWMAAPARAQEIDTAPAMAAAQAWVAMLDARQYARSWEASSGSFRDNVSRNQWEASMQSSREPLGPVLSRKIRAVDTRQLAGATPSEFVMIQFDTRFENRPLTIEVVTPTLEADGSWKVSAYQIR
jgi:uncharacterized protein DUF4019